MDQTTVIINSYWGMEKERRKGQTQREKRERKGWKNKDGREGVDGEKQEEEGKINEQMIVIREEETGGQAGVDAEGQIRLYDKGSWGWTLVSLPRFPQGFCCW